MGRIRPSHSTASRQQPPLKDARSDASPTVTTLPSDDEADQILLLQMDDDSSYEGSPPLTRTLQLLYCLQPASTTFLHESAYFPQCDESLRGQRTASKLLGGRRRAQRYVGRGWTTRPIT
ncbi:protein of unknown function (plasmid) [Caballeronia sp. S22]